MILEVDPKAGVGTRWTARTENREFFACGSSPIDAVALLVEIMEEELMAGREW